MTNLPHVQPRELSDQLLADIAEERANISPRDYEPLDLALQHIKYLMRFKSELEELEFTASLDDVTHNDIAEALERAKGG